MPPRPIHNKRYEVIRKLGEGGLGVVYEANDRERGIRVALKTLRRPTQEAAFRLKQEFRRLSGIEHPNLVNLYDLHVGPNEVFFTMELATGCDFLSYVRGTSVDIDADTVQLPGSALDTKAVTNHVAIPIPHDLEAAQQEARASELFFDEGRLREVLSQLALGLHALHSFGKIHRDIKSSNIRISPSGQLKILDFGLATGIDTPGDMANGSSSGLGEIVGTLAYMSPEQAASEPRLGPATDWYAMGVLLFEALTGRLPFQGRPIAVLANKTQSDPPKARSLAPNAPLDLSTLCDQLLVRDVELRIRSRAILDQLQHTETISKRMPAVSRDQECFFVGRHLERVTIEAALDSVQTTRHARTLVISGASGIGKSALVAQVLTDMGPGVLVLRGRCYEWEKVSYKAMDGVIDELATYWASLKGEDAARLLPRDARLLSIVFPALDRVRVVARSRTRNIGKLPPAIRGDAFTAVRETLDRLAIQQPLVLFLDDMQWADQDTIDLLKTLLRSPQEPPLLLILSTRPQGLEDKTPLSELLSSLGNGAHLLPLGRLGERDCLVAARSLLGDAQDELALKAVSEAEGNPYFLTELACSYREGVRRGQLGGVDDLIRERANTLPADDRRLLELLCAAQGPLALPIAARAVQLDAAKLATAIKSLRHKNLLRNTSAQEEGSIAPYHDRVRHAIVSALSAESVCARHHSIAETLEQLSPEEPERIVRHWLFAENTKKAAHWSLPAAKAALVRLNFARAADFLATSIRHGNHSPEQRQRLQIRLATALASSGSPKKAAQAYEKALDFPDLSKSESIEFRRLIAENLMFAGDINAALQAAQELAHEFKLTYPTNRATTLMHMAAGELRLARAHRRGDQTTENCDHYALQRTDVAESLAMGLSGADALRSMVFTQQWALHALKVGSPARCARALASLSILASMQNAPKRSYKYLDSAKDWAKQSGSPISESYVLSARALACFYLENNWKGTRQHFDKALTLWEQEGRGYSHAVGIMHIFSNYAASYQGDMREVVASVPKLIDDAARSGNRVLEASMQAGFAHRHLAGDDPQQAEDDLRRFRRHWPNDHFLWQHWLALLRGAEIHLYQQQPERAMVLIEESRRRLRNSMLTQLHMVKCEFLHLEARCLLALAQRRKQITPLLRRVENFSKLLAKSDLDLAKAWAHLLAGAVCNIRGQHASASSRLQRSHALFERIGSMLYASATGRYLGVLMGGDDGNRMLAKAEISMARQGIQKPTRMAAMLAPGF